MDDALVMHRTGVVQLMEQVVHLLDIDAAAALVSERPDDHAGVVLVTVEDVADSEEYGAFPVRIITRNNVLFVLLCHVSERPCAVSLHVRLVDHIEAEVVSQRINIGIVGIMTGSDRIDVVALHIDQVMPGLGKRDRTARDRTEFVAVNAVEHYSLSVDL